VPLELGSGEAVVVGWPDKWSGESGRVGVHGRSRRAQVAQTGNDTLAEFTLTAA